MDSLLESLRASLRGRPPDPLRLDPRLRRWALRTGMAPLLCSSLDRASPDDALKASVIAGWPELEGAVLEARLRSELLRSTLTEILRSVTPALRRPPILLKGSAASEHLYPRPHLRPMRDLDLLLHAEDVAAFEGALESLGYQQRSANPVDYYADHHHGMPFFDLGRAVWIEAHTDLFPARDALARTTVFARATWQLELRDSAFEGHSVSCFSPEYQLVHTACHWSAELDPVASLPALVDLSLLLRRHGETLDWERIFGWLEDPVVRARAIPVIAYLEADRLVDLRRLAVGRRLRREVRRLGRTSVSLQHRLIRSLCFEGAPPGRILTANNRAVLWTALSRPGSSFARLASAAWQVIFPPQAADRYSPGFQLSRLRRALRSSGRS